MEKPPGYGPGIVGSNPTGSTKYGVVSLMVKLAVVVRVLGVRFSYYAPTNLRRKYMTREQKKQVLEVRLNNVKARGKHIENPGVVRKLERQLRNLMN